MKLSNFSYLLFLLTIQLSYGQSYKIIYELKWKSTETEKDYQSELTTLIRNHKESYFESLAKFKYDSLKTSLVLQGYRNFPSPKEEWKFQPLIIKDLKSQSTTVEYEFFDKVYLTKYDCKPKWTIKEIKSKIYITSQAEKKN